MRTERHPCDDRTERRRGDRLRSDKTDRGAGMLKCGICAGPLADHEIGDHANRVVERMLRIGFPTPVGTRLP
ncbi:MAG: hypothetical protein BMS9Abin12_1165 [Acidimicrobiia bacterium]|nr:MAG: hypothetical protein BMS9Abin12_1165 [Acidimicrobiia bacterium]